MVGAVIIFVGFIIAGVTSSNYSQIAIQAQQFGECYDYSSGTAMRVSCTETTHDDLLYLGLSFGLIAIGGLILVKGIRGKWDQNVKSNEMVGPKGR